MWGPIREGFTIMVLGGDIRGQLQTLQAGVQAIIAKLGTMEETMANGVSREELNAGLDGVVQKVQGMIQPIATAGADVKQLITDIQAKLNAANVPLDFSAEKAKADAISAQVDAATQAVQGMDRDALTADTNLAGAPPPPVAPGVPTEPPEAPTEPAVTP